MDVWVGSSSLRSEFMTFTSLSAYCLAQFVKPSFVPKGGPTHSVHNYIDILITNILEL